MNHDMAMDGLDCRALIGLDCRALIDRPYQGQCGATIRIFLHIRDCFAIIIDLFE